MEQKDSPDKRTSGVFTKVRNSFRGVFKKTDSSQISQTGDESKWGETNSEKQKEVSEKEVILTQLLHDLGQHHLFVDWAAKGVDEDKKRIFFDQVAELNQNYPGGLKAYVERARVLLEAAKNGENSLDGWIPSVPQGISLEPCTERFNELEIAGQAALGQVGFVLVAGGLGERLGKNSFTYNINLRLSSLLSYFLYEDRL